MHDGLRAHPRQFLGAHPGVVRRRVPRADARPARRVDGDRAPGAHAGRRADRVRQDAVGVPVGDRPTRHRPERTGKTKVLYISPLKALAVDVERNLRAPLVGIGQTAERLGLPAPQISVGVRSGDTSAADRRSMLRTPPDILITTPESLFLMLTSAARESLDEVETVIVDEVHAIAGSKRGSHLALSLERLDAALTTPAQRIGLSATVRPPEEVGRFLTGTAPITIVNPPAPKTFDLSVRVPLEDMTELGVSGGVDDAARNPGSIWPHVESDIVDLVLEHRSCIVFANSRRLAERLTARLNEIYAERLEIGVDLDHAPPALLGSSSEVNHGAEQLLARAHHGSVSKEQRALIEDDLKSGRLRCVVATSSLELGIDMGAVDLVIQVEAPPSVSSGLQRVGRAGPPGRRDLPRGHVPQAPHRRHSLRGHVDADDRGPDRGAAHPRQPARHPRPADRRRLRAGTDRRGRLVRRGPAHRQLRDAAPLGVRVDAGSALGSLPVRRVRRVAAPAGMGPRRRHPHRPPRLATPRRHLGRRDPRPRPVRGVHGRREAKSE